MIKKITCQKLANIWGEPIYLRNDLSAAFLSTWYNYEKGNYSNICEALIESDFLIDFNKYMKGKDIFDKEPVVILPNKRYRIKNRKHKVFKTAQDFANYTGGLISMDKEIRCVLLHDYHVDDVSTIDRCGKDWDKIVDSTIGEFSNFVEDCEVEIPSESYKTEWFKPKENSF